MRWRLLGVDHPGNDKRGAARGHRSKEPGRGSWTPYPEDRVRLLGLRLVDDARNVRIAVHDLGATIVFFTDLDLSVLGRDTVAEELKS